jgi:predicted negative regulator of RcsB-dependent stress response
MTDYENMKRASSREWAAAKIVVIGGLIVALVVAGYFGWQHYQDLKQQQLLASPAYQQQQAAQLQKKSQVRLAGMVLCAMELANAQKMGLIPSYGKLAKPMPYTTKNRGEYACFAATQVLAYEITAHLICRELSDPKCTRVMSIKLNDGTQIYKAK